jgi:hypothetical protein
MGLQKRLAGRTCYRKPRLPCPLHGRAAAPSEAGAGRRARSGRLPVGAQPHAPCPDQALAASSAALKVALGRITALTFCGSGK